MLRTLLILSIVSACGVAPIARPLAAAEKEPVGAQNVPAAAAPAIENKPAAGAPSVPATLDPATLVPGATTIYNYGFEPLPGEEPDDWPPGWTRRRGPGFPIYLPVTITHESFSAGQYSLRMQLNGGGVEMFSPPVPCSTLANYEF